MQHIQHGQGFNVQGLVVQFVLDLAAGQHFRLGKDAVLHHQVHVLLAGHAGQGFRRGFIVIQPALRRFFHPGVGVAVAVEHDALMIQVDFFYQFFHGGVQFFRRGAFQLIRHPLQFFCHNSVQIGVGTGQAGLGTCHAEFKLVAGKGKGRRPVAVCVIFAHRGQGVAAEFHLDMTVGFILLPGSNGLQHPGEFCAQEDADDGRRRFVGSQTVIVACAGHGATQHVLIFIDTFDDGRQEQQELVVVIRVAAGIQQVFPFQCGQGPVVVLAAAVHAVKGLFMEQADHAVL